MTELAKTFEPAPIEARWIAQWERTGQFTPSLEAGKPSFSIQLPPPNVTGTLHMGHAFNQTIMDSLTRYHRMRGFNTLWVPGTDHAGIATQIVVERQLEQQGKTRHDLGRDAFNAQGLGVETCSRARSSRSRCAAWVRASTGRMSTSRWTTTCPRSSPTRSSSCTSKA